MNLADRTAENLMPPPKRLVRTSSGLLRTMTFEGIDAYVKGPVDVRCISSMIDDGSPRVDVCRVELDHLELSCTSGFQAFVFDPCLEHFRFRATLEMEGLGKCGIVFRIHAESRDGYYLSLDLLKGVAQLRAWGTDSYQRGEHMMQFSPLQMGFWFSSTRGRAEVQLIAFGSYIELSIDGRVVLTLADRSFDSGQLGIYLETAAIRVSELQVDRLDPPSQSDEHLVSG